MSAIGDFANRVKADYERIGTAIDAIREDVAGLNAKIEQLQNSQGQITPEDQATLDEIQAAAANLADRIGEVDNLTPPAPPPDNP